MVDKNVIVSGTSTIRQPARSASGSLGDNNHGGPLVVIVFLDLDLVGIGFFIFLLDVA